MGETVLVEVDGTQFYVEVAERQGVGTVGLDHDVSFDGVRDTVAAIAGELAEVWNRVQPDEAKVDFGLKLSAKSGRLTGLLVEGGGEASLAIALTWKKSPAGAAGPES
jgi:hypothetical protein